VVRPGRAPPFRREARVARDSTDVAGVADDGLDAVRPRVGPRPRVNAYLHAALVQCLNRALDEALRATERRVALANDAESHRGAIVPVSSSNAITAANARSCGSVSRQAGEV